MSASGCATVKDQLPESSAVVVPRDAPSAKSSTVLPASAVPVKVGVGSLVTVLDPELMTGAAIAMAQESDWPIDFYILSLGVSTHHELTAKPTIAFIIGGSQIIHLKHARSMLMLDISEANTKSTRVDRLGCSSLLGKQQG